MINLTQDKKEALSLHLLKTHSRMFSSIAIEIFVKT
jgi:hypothetical protein